MADNIKVEIFEKYMKEHNLSKTGFCKLCKISLSTFDKIMTGKSSFRAIALFKIAKVIKIEVYQMFD